MKKVSIFVLSLLAIASILLAVAPAKAGSPNDDKLMAATKQLWEQFKMKDAKGFSAGLTADAVEVAANGMMMTKDQIVADLNGSTVAEYNLTDMSVMWLDKDAALVHYSATMKGKDKDGHDFPAGPVHCTTAFVLSGGKWLGKFHQETMVMNMMAH